MPRASGRKRCPYRDTGVVSTLPGDDSVLRFVRWLLDLVPMLEPL